MNTPDASHASSSFSSSSFSIPQPQAVTAGAGGAAHYVVLNIAPGEEAENAVRAFFGNAAGLRRSVGHRDDARQLNLVVGIGSDAWDRLFGSPRPAHLHPFKELRGAKHHAPATPGDLLLHVRADTVDMCQELVMQAMRALDGAVQPVDEVHGFRYFDARSMVGFVDGTENPEGQEAFEATVIGEEDPDFAGGSYVIVQKYLHDMKAWNALTTEEQERVMGRTKADDIELPDEVKPANSHVALNVVEGDDGNEMAILRGNLPFATPSRGEYGTYFIGYARNPAVTELMLTNMFIGRPEGNYDRLLDYSTAVTGTLFFVPSEPLLQALAEGNPLAGEASAGDAAAAPADAAAAADTAASSALAIGSLKGQPQEPPPARKRG